MHLFHEISQTIKSLPRNELSNEFTDNRAERAESSERCSHATGEHVLLRESS